jgi:hypothetical protein
MRLSINATAIAAIMMPPANAIISILFEASRLRLSKLVKFVLLVLVDISGVC